MAMKHIDIFNLSDFMIKLTNADGQLTEEQLRKLVKSLASAKDVADTTLNHVKRERLKDSEAIRKAAIAFLRQNGVGKTLEMYNPCNQEDCVVITITNVSDGQNNHLLIKGTCEPYSTDESIGSYGSKISISHERQIELSLAPDDLNFAGYSTEPPFVLSIEGYRKHFCLRG